METQNARGIGHNVLSLTTEGAAFKLHSKKLKVYLSHDRRRQKERINSNSWGRVDFFLHYVLIISHEYC